MNNRKKKVLAKEEVPEFRASIEQMEEDSRIFVDRSVEIAHHIFLLMEQKGMKQKDLAERMGKSEAEVSKWLGGLHNYTLRSLAKLEAALGSAVICTPKQSYGYVRKTLSKKSTFQTREKEVGPLKTNAFKYTPVVCMSDYENSKNRQPVAI